MSVPGRATEEHVEPPRSFDVEERGKFLWVYWAVPDLNAVPLAEAESLEDTYDTFLGVTDVREQREEA